MYGLISAKKTQDFVFERVGKLLEEQAGQNLGAVAQAQAASIQSALQDNLDTARTMSVSLFSLAVTVLVAIRGRGLLKLVPILSGIVAGYALSLILGIVDFSPVAAAPWFAVPRFTGPTFSLDAILVIVPVAIAPIIEHFGGVLAIGQVTGRNYLEKPGIHRSLLGDGVATFLAGCLGGPPLTTYAEVTGAVALTKIYNPGLMVRGPLVAGVCPGAGCR